MKFSIAAIFLLSIAAVYLLWPSKVEQIERRTTAVRVEARQNMPAIPIQLPLGRREIVIEKQRRVLTLFVNGRPVRTYRVALGFSPDGAKQKRGDGRTPEGSYCVGVKNSQSRFYLSLGLSYPNTQDASGGLRSGLTSNGEAKQISKATQRGVLPPQNTALGGDIFIHGGGIRGDWTHGCIALENANMRELFDTVTVGTPVMIKP